MTKKIKRFFILTCFTLLSSFLYKATPAHAEEDSKEAGELILCPKGQTIVNHLCQGGYT